MQQAVNQIIDFFQQGIEWIIRFLQFIWRWSFGEIVTMFQTQLPKFAILPLWKQVFIVVVVSAILYLLYYVFRDVVDAIRKVLDAFVTLIRAIVDNLVHILIAGVIAFGGSWAINNMTIAWLP